MGLPGQEKRLFLRPEVGDDREELEVLSEVAPVRRKLREQLERLVDEARERRGARGVVVRQRRPLHGGFGAGLRARSRPRRTRSQRRVRPAVGLLAAVAEAERNLLPLVRLPAHTPLLLRHRPRSLAPQRDDARASVEVAVRNQALEEPEVRNEAASLLNISHKHVQQPPAALDAVAAPRQQRLDELDPGLDLGAAPGVDHRVHEDARGQLQHDPALLQPLLQRLAVLGDGEEAVERAHALGEGQIGGVEHQLIAEQLDVLRPHCLHDLLRHRHPPVDAWRDPVRLGHLYVCLFRLG
eukprot:3614556-Rhodomonas_salina.3